MEEQHKWWQKWCVRTNLCFRNWLQEDLAHSDTERPQSVARKKNTHNQQQQQLKHEKWSRVGGTNDKIRSRIHEIARQIAVIWGGCMKVNSGTCTRPFCGSIKLVGCSITCALPICPRILHFMRFWNREKLCRFAQPFVLSYGRSLWAIYYGYNFINV